jgi:tRNA threonylcarbamoyladenosine biosynthesis protein TsaB
MRMAIILALETSTEIASAALMHGEQTITRESSGVQTHSQTILPMVQGLLKEAGLSLTQCDAIAFGAGPGSFTGVRTACGIAQGLAFGAGLPLVPVVTLQAMAQACRETSGESNVLALLDARMDEVYWAQYRFSEGWQVVAEPSISSPSEVLPSGEVVACGNGIAVCAAGTGVHRRIGKTWPEIMPHAVYIAQLGRIEFLANRTVAPRDAQPIYLRNKVALTTAERMARVAS